MLKRHWVTCLLLALTAAAVASTVVAAVPDGPRLAVLRLSHDQTKAEIATLGPSGEDYRRLLPASPRQARKLGVLSIPAWSSDGTQLAFSHRRGKRWRISIVSAGGGQPHLVPGTAGGVLPVFAPDGKSLAFTRVRREKRGRYAEYESASVWIVDLESGVRRQLTRWREHLEHFASSFSPDGTTLLVTRFDYDERSGDPETVALRFDGRTSSLLVGEGLFPVYSPDGSQIALFRFHGHDEQSDLYVIDADGTMLHRLTRTPHRDELFASWDPSGKRIAYSAFREFEPRETATIMQVNADSTCAGVVLSIPQVALHAPAWQPGPGREAGRIAC